MPPTCAMCQQPLTRKEAAVSAVELIPIHSFGDPIAGFLHGRFAFFHPRCFGPGLPGWEKERLGPVPDTVDSSFDPETRASS